MALVVLHEDRGADLPILLGHVLDAIGEHQRLVSRAENAIAVDGHFDHVAGGLARKLLVNGGRQDFIVSVHVAQREFDTGEDVPRLTVGDLVGELDELAVLDGVTHAESESAQKMDAAKTLTSPSS